MTTIKKLFTSALVALVASFVLVTPVQAAPVTMSVSQAQMAFTDCAVYAGTVCFHERPDYTGRVWRQTPEEIGSCRNFGPDNFDNQASTAFNNVEHSFSIRIYRYANCTGESMILVSGYYYSFGNGAHWNDLASSVAAIAAIAS
jgi:hypothetical protein